MHVYKIVETLVEAGTDNTVREFDSLEEACDLFRRKCAETSLDSESGLHFTYRLIKQECGRRKKLQTVFICGKCCRIMRISFWLCIRVKAILTKIKKYVTIIESVN